MSLYHSDKETTVFTNFSYSFGKTYLLDFHLLDKEEEKTTYSKREIFESQINRTPFSARPNQVRICVFFAARQVIAIYHDGIIRRNIANILFLHGAEPPSDMPSKTQHTYTKIYYNNFKGNSTSHMRYAYNG